MIFSIFYIINAAETFLLSAYMAAVGSSIQRTLIFNLSPLRLAIVLFFFICGLGFTILAVQSLNIKSNFAAMQRKYLNNEPSQWQAFAITLSIAGLALFLLSRQVNAFGEFKLVYERFEPVLVWLEFLAIQAAFLTAVWYFAHFITADNKQDMQATEKELLPLLGLYLAFVVIKLVFISRNSYGPIGRGDEITYFDMADSFYRGFFSVAKSHHYPPLYPLLIMPALVFKTWTFDGIKLLNALFSSSIIFPIYFITRRFLDAPRSLAAAFLSCLIPFHMVYPRRILSENLFFPLFLWTMAITFTVPRSQKYRLHWDLLNGIMMAAIYLTRFISLAVIPFLLLSWWAKLFEGEQGFFKPGWQKVKSFGLLIAALLAAFSPWLYAGLRDQVQLKLILGFTITSRTTAEQLTIQNLLIWAVLYACYFVLVAAPVLHLLVSAIAQIDLKRWREGFGRWFFQVLMVMGGFYAAVIRHSFRAYYNAILPSTLMGRYLIVFSPVYFVIALIALSHFKQSNFHSKRHFILTAQLLPFGLVLIAYFILVEGMIIPTNGNLLRNLESVDVFFTEVLGGWFFLLLFLIYGITNWLIWKGAGKPAFYALILGLVVYYAAGIPSYSQTIMDYQTYPWLSSQIARFVPQPAQEGGDAEQITVFLPQESTSKNKAEIYNGLRTRGVNNTIIEDYSPEAVADMGTDIGFIIQLLKSGENYSLEYPILHFNKQEFVIIPVKK